MKQPINQVNALVIAIDGPVASGKTVIGRKLAQELGLRYLDTGIMYRAITWLALQRGVYCCNRAALERLAIDYPMEVAGIDGGQVTIGGQTVANELREPAVTAQVSLVSQAPGVRREMVRQQRSFASFREAQRHGVLEARRGGVNEAHRDGVVMVGRDIGTVVLPDAGLKVYLTASVRERARRRWKELAADNRDVALEQVVQETEERDRLDSERAESPLTAAADAWVLDTSNLSIEQVVELIVARACGGASEKGERAALA